MQKFVGKWKEVKKEGFEAFADAVGVDEAKRAPFLEPNAHFEIKCDGGQWVFIVRVANCEQSVNVQIGPKFEYKDIAGKCVTSQMKIEGDKFVEDLTTQSGLQMNVIREVVGDQLVVTSSCKGATTKSFFNRE